MKITLKQYAEKIVEVAYHEILPNKETVCNIVIALIDEYCGQQTAKLNEQLSKLQGKTNFDEVEVLKELLNARDKEIISLKERVIFWNEAHNDLIHKNPF